MTLLDDLLGYPEPKAPRRPPTGYAARGGELVIAGVVALGAWALGRHLGLGAPFAVVLACTVALTVLRWVLREVRSGPVPELLRDIPPPPGRDGPPDGIRRASRRWEERIEWTYDSPGQFNVAVRPAIADLVEERLRLNHGVSLTGDPERAAAIVGPHLWSFIHQPVTRNMTERDIATIVTHMEAL